MVVIRFGIVEDGKPLLPERFSLEKIEELRRSFGALFPLLYMNNPVDKSLVDFDEADLRYYLIDGGDIVFDEDDRDVKLNQSYGSVGLTQVPALLRGQRLTPDLQRRLAGSGVRLVVR